VDIDTLQAKYTALAPVLTERSRRLWAATEAMGALAPIPASPYKDALYALAEFAVNRTY